MLCDFFGDDQTYQENLLSKYYRKLGYEVVIIASTNEDIKNYVNEIHDNSKPNKVYVNELGVKIYRLPYSFNIKNKLKKFGDIDKILEVEAPDLIFLHGIHLNLKEAYHYSKKNNCKIIMDFHGDYSNSGKNIISLKFLHGVIRKSFLYKYKSQISNIYAVVPESMKFLEEIYNLKKTEIQLLPLGCDYDYIQKIKEEINLENLYNEFRIKQNDYVIITGGKINPLKKTDVLVDAMKILNRSDVHLIIFGNANKDDEEYENKMKENAKGQNIYFSGWVTPERSYQLMAIADIAVFPSSQSVLWQQAIGMGIPLIAGDSGGQDMSYLNVNDNLIKISKENINPEFFAKTIQDLLSDTNKLNKMKEGAEKTAKEFLNYEIIANKTLECLK